jgi:hypothetical protein
MMSNTKKVAALFAATGGLVLAGAGAAGAATAPSVGSTDHDPGVVTGNVVEVPVNAPINVCGNTVSGIGLLDWAFGNHCQS